MECRVCGSPLDVTDTRCAACGALALADDELWQAARAADEPTQEMPAVARPPDPALTYSPPTADFAAAPVPPETNPPAAVGPAPAMSAPHTIPPPREEVQPDPRPVSGAVLARRPSRVRREVVLVAIAGAALAFLFLVGVWAIANRPASSPEGVAASTTPAPALASGAAEGVSCEPRSLEAATGGRWRLYRAEYGPRERYDYLRLQLRREGADDRTAALTASVMTLDDAAVTHGVDMPGDVDVALVVAFDGPVGISSSWGANAGYAALRGFRVERGADDSVVLVAGVRGEGCFAMTGGWDADQSDITLEIARP